jgi:hypothetical protein
VALSGCDSDPTSPPPGDVIEETFIFDADMEGWQGVATDTLNPPIDWHVEHTTAEAYTGDGAVELFLNNINDQGKVWLERAYTLVPGAIYQVDLEYTFGTSDWGNVNLFTIIAGVHDEPPRSAEELTFQDEDTGHGGDEDVGLVWEERSYSFTVEAPSDGTVHVALGVWGTWETARTYFVDALTVRFTPVQ